MPTCVIIGCTSGYRSNQEKCHHFAVPRDPVIRELWNKAIKPSGIEVKTGQSVCEKHFNPEEITWQRKLLGPDGTLLGISQYKIPRLRKGSVPSTFPWTDLVMPVIDTSSGKADDPIIVDDDPVKCISTHELALNEFSFVPAERQIAASNRNMLRKIVSQKIEPVGNITESLKIILDSKNRNVQCKKHIVETKDSIATSDNDFNAPNDQSKDRTASMPCVTLEQLSASDISMPKGWNKQAIVYKDTILIVFSITRCTMNEDKAKTFILKELILKSDMTFHINVLGKPVDIKDLRIDVSPVTSVERMQDLLYSLNGLNICAGTKLFNHQHRNIGSTIYEDPSGMWRHVKCSILWSTIVCPFCRTARKSAMAKNRRIEKQAGVMKYIGPSEISEKKERLVRLQRKYHATQKAALRAKCTIAKLKAIIDKYRKKMTEIGGSLDEYLESTKLPKNHVCSLREIVAAAKCENSRGRRYSKNWVLMCIMLHMRSPAGYTFLQKNQILPLPDGRTVRRYLTGTDTICDVHPEFFKDFEFRLANKDDIPKHGILLISEDTSTETMIVNMKTISQKRVFDICRNGEEGLNVNEKRNRGFLITFCPLIDDSSRPITVLSSQRSLKGNNLATLIVKAIVLLERVDAKVHAVVTNGSGACRKFWHEMGVTGQRKHLRNCFQHPISEGRRIFVFCDTLHLIQTIRNRLFLKKVLQMDPTQPPIKWSDIETLYKKDKELIGSGKDSMCPKLTKSHFVFKNCANERTRLAVQVFSNSVARGLRFFKECVPELEDCEGTASFCKWINEMFDALSRKNSNGGLQPNDSDYKILEESIRKLNTWEENMEKGLISKELFLTPHTAEGLRVTLQSTLEIVTYLTNRYDFPYVLTGRINQDTVDQVSNKPRDNIGLT